MSDKPYEKECTYCKNKILMSKESGSWLPYDLNNGPHECKKRQAVKQEFTLEAVQKKLASIGITLDLDRLMNQK
jgi:hypothetical protein